MANKLDIKKLDLPEDWSDDIRMNFLFATFREKFVNPEGWEEKMRFWMNFIINFCLKCHTPVINRIMLRKALGRKGKFPECLDLVLENMHNKGLITTNFPRLEPEKGWIGWGYDMLIQKPISWGFSTVQGLLYFSKEEQNFIVIAVVQELSRKVLERHHQLVRSELIDNVRYLDTFEEQCKDICSGIDFNLAIIELQKEKNVHIFEHKGRKVIKFCNQDGKKFKPLTELERGVLNLQTAKDVLMEDIDALEKNIHSSTQEIRQLLALGYKTKAMFSLKQKKRLEAILKKKSVAVDNIDSLLCQLQNSDSEKMVLEAYKTGAQAIKATVKDDLNLDDIDSTMAEVEGVLDDYEEVKKTLSKSVTPGSLDEFEDELNELLASEKKEDTKKKQPSPARVPSEDDLLKRLAALRAPPEGVPPIKKPAILATE